MPVPVTVTLPVAVMLTSSPPSIQIPCPELVTVATLTVVSPSLPLFPVRDRIPAWPCAASPVAVTAPVAVILMKALLLVWALIPDSPPDTRPAVIVIPRAELLELPAVVAYIPVFVLLTTAPAAETRTFALASLLWAWMPTPLAVTDPALTVIAAPACTLIPSPPALVAVAAVSSTSSPALTEIAVPEPPETPPESVSIAPEVELVTAIPPAEPLTARPVPLCVSVTSSPALRTSAAESLAVAVTVAPCGMVTESAVVPLAVSVCTVVAAPLHENTPDPALVSRHPGAAVR